MASTILYKFRSGTTFEALPLPGSAARLFDVKKAIVKAKKLDTGMEFDLGVKNADTNEEYVNESMLLPRGTRLIVQRLPAARGLGFLARMARNEHAGTNAPSSSQQSNAIPGSTPSGFYTIDSRARDDEDEFVQSGGGDEERELAALQAVTSLRSDGPAMSGGGFSGGGRGGHSQGGPGGGGRGNFKPSFRPNADPELREQERKLMPKKRATGIPRTFLNLSAPPQTDGNKEGGENDSSVPLLQPNTQGFVELVHRGGGQSENTSGTRRDLDYALKVTATTIPEYLQCGICHSVVKNAMLLPWDPEGRTACETCIRDALTQNGFRCPLTGMDGVSPDDLHPNHGLRKAAELFIKGVMEKIDEIEKQQVEEAEDVANENGDKADEANLLEGDRTEKGVIVSKRSSLSSRKKSDFDDPFGGGDDDFGGDVFAVEKPAEDDDGGKESAKDEDEMKSAESSKDKPSESEENKESATPNEDKTLEVDNSKSKSDESENHSDKDFQISTNKHKDEMANEEPDKQQDAPTPQRDRRDQRRRGPPVGYAMGPAGGAVGGPTGRGNDRDNHKERHDNRRGGRGRGRGDYPSPPGGRGGRGGGFQDFHEGGPDRGGMRGRGRGRGRGRFGGRGEMDNGSPHNMNRGPDDDDSRGTKRSWDEQSDGRWDPRDMHHRRDDRYGPGFDDRHAGGGPDRRGPDRRGRPPPGPPPRDFHRNDGGGRGGGGGGRGGFRGGGRGGRPWGRGPPRRGR